MSTWLLLAAFVPPVPADWNQATQPLVWVQGRSVQVGQLLAGDDEGPILLAGNAMLRPHRAEYINYRLPMDIVRTIRDVPTTETRRPLLWNPITERWYYPHERPWRYCAGIIDGDGMTKWVISTWGSQTGRVGF